MTFDTPEKELEWIDHFQNTYNTTLTEREKIIYHIAFEDGERNQVRRINAEKIREMRKRGQTSIHMEPPQSRGFSQGDPIQRIDDTPFGQGDPIEKLG